VGWQASRGISGSFRLESVAALLWNQWQPSYGINGRLPVESVATFVWNRWQVCRGISGRFGVEYASVVDFRIFNRTSRQFKDVELLFSVGEPKGQMTLVSGGIITPSSLPHAETVEELQVNDTINKKFRLKVIPKQRKTEYFEAVFV
jgi:hypothetical protein